jgi:hypothetical protein
MKFNDLAWGAVGFYYRCAGDKRYSDIMKDAEFLKRLRCQPGDISPKEFEIKAILGFIKLESYDLLVSHQLAKNVMDKIILLQPELSGMNNLSLLECDLNDKSVSDALARVYNELQSYGLWITGASKIAHILNNHLFPVISPALTRHFNVTDSGASIRHWLLKTQNDLQEAASDFSQQGLPGTPEQYLSRQLGYSAQGYEKSMVKFADEYYWLRYAAGLSVPPRWTPALNGSAV